VHDGIGVIDVAFDALLEEVRARRFAGSSRDLS
jgi:hypothetical protein